MRTPLLSLLPLLLPALAAQRVTSPQEPPVADAARAAADRAGIGAGVPSAVVFDRPGEGGPLWALGRAWKASFDEHGMTVIPFFGSSAPQNFPLGFELVRATVAGRELELADGEPVVTGAAVHTARGTVTEVVETGLDRLEQSFVFASLPERGAVAVELRVDTALAASPVEGGVRFANEHGHVDYTKAVAVDAAGRSVPLAIEWTGSGVRIEIPAAFVAEAALPLVLDPVLNFWYLLGSNPAQLQHDSDVASIQAQNLGGRTLLIYQRQWSASDQDCCGILFDGCL
jgi:hypothetical protein